MKFDGDKPVTITLPFDLWLLGFYCLFYLVENVSKLKKMRVFPLPACKPLPEEITRLSALLCGILIDSIKEDNNDVN